MVRSLFTAATGMRTQQINVDNIANNLANVNTVGYKTQKTEFKTLLYQTIQTKTTTVNGVPKPITAQVGLGSRVASNTSIFSQGNMLSSDSTADFAINGAGFFAVRGTEGEIYYTRNGNFNWTIGNDGTSITTSDGYYVLDTNGNPIVLPNGVGTSSAVITEAGQIGYQTADGNYVDLGQTFGMYQFNNPAGLERQASTLFRETEASGEAMNEATTPTLIKSKIAQGYLEGSNVQVGDEMVNLIVAQRAYEMNSKAITTSDQMLEMANNLKR